MGYVLYRIASSYKRTLSSSSSPRVYNEITPKCDYGVTRIASVDKLNEPESPKAPPEIA